MPTYNPWGTPLLAFADTVRVVCCLLGILLCVASGAFALRHRNNLAGVMAAVALAFLAASAIGTEYQHIGTVVTYRLWTNTFGVLFGLIGMVHMIRRDRRAGT